MKTAISLFAGAGGCSLGFKNAGYEITYATDINQQAVSTYKINLPKTPCEQQDIADIDFYKLLHRFKLKRGEIDIVIGGPPCQGFSSAGLQFWDDPRNSMLKQYVRALNILKPKWFLMENVEGLLTANKGTYIYEISKAFIEIGYSIRIDKIYAHEFGVPQRRKRVFIIGNCVGANYDPPKVLTHATGAIFRKSGISVSDALNGLPNASSQLNEAIPFDTLPGTDWEIHIRRNAEHVTLHYSPELSEIQLARIRGLKEGQSMKHLPPDLQHDSFKRRSARRVMDGTPTEKRGGAPSGLKRLIGGEPSLTITGAATREFIHPHKDRPLTIRECARLQTFPDDFYYYGSQSQITQQIGNAIPPILAEYFAAHIIQIDESHASKNSFNGGLIGFSLTKAQAMSPALKSTHKKLTTLANNHFQPTLF